MGENYRYYISVRQIEARPCPMPDMDGWMVREPGVIPGRFDEHWVHADIFKRQGFVPLSQEPWIGVDLDGTLAYYDHWRGEEHIGAPIVPMVERVKEWLAAGERVKIFTARASNGPRQIEVIKDWCREHLGRELEVTNLKDFMMVRLWDDRCVQVVENTGQRATTSAPTEPRP